MSHNLIEVSTFTASVSVPDPGDARTAASVEVPYQALANRTRNNKDRLDAILSQNASYTVGDVTDFITSGDKIKLTQLGATAGLTLVGREVTAVNAGFYHVLASMTVLSVDVTNPLAHTISVDVNGVAQMTSRSTRFSNAAADLGVCIVVNAFLTLTAGQKFSLTNRGPTGVFADPLYSQLTIVRLY